MTLDDRELGKLIRLAAVLIPGSAGMPAIAEVEAFAALLRAAVKACGTPDAELRATLDRLPVDADQSSVLAFAAADPARFEIAAILVSGAYFMSPLVLERLGYPLERRHPAGLEEFAEEYETGVLEPVLGRGPRFRDPR